MYCVQANIAKHRSDFREVAIHGAANWVHSRYGQLSTSKSGACEVVSLASAMPWLQIQSSEHERRALQFLSRVATGTDDTIFQRCRDIVIQAYTRHKKHIRTRTYQVTSRGKDVALIRTSSLDSRWLRILTADRQWVPLRNTQMEDLCSRFPTT